MTFPKTLRQSAVRGLKNTKNAVSEDTAFRLFRFLGISKYA